MKKFILLALIFISIFLFSNTLIRIDKNEFDNINNVLKSIDIAGINDKYFDIFVNEKNLQLIKDNNINFVEIPYVINKADFLYLQEAYDLMDSIHYKFPAITAIETLNFTSQYNLPLKILKINGNNPNEYNNQNAFLLMAMHHAREWQTVSQAIFFADSLLSQYNSDSLITNIINNDFIIIFPIVNPDGYCFSRDSLNTSWRKNRTLRNDIYGVDLNRNYGGGINTDLQCDWGYIANSATTHYQGSDVYCGPYSNSEIEVLTVQDLIKEYNFNISVSLHSYGEMIIWPWGSVYYGAADSVLLEYIGTQIANRIICQDDSSTYIASQSADLYPTTGDSDDWIYGWTKYIKGKTTFPFTFEIDRNFNSSTSEQLDTLYRRVYPGIEYALIMIDSLSDRIKEAPLKPILEISGDSIKWNIVNAENVNFFTLNNYSYPNITIDSVNTNQYLNNFGFNISSERSYSGNYSYKTDNQIYSSDVLENYYRIFVNENDSLIFYVFYDLEANYDKAFVEISENGFEYKIADTINGIFTGSNSSFQRIAISLEDYINKEIYYRFRIIFDGSTLNEGVYIDNIFPLLYFENDSICFDSLETSFIELYFMEDSDNYFSILPNSNEYQYMNFNNKNNINISDRIFYETAFIENVDSTLSENNIYFDINTKILKINYYNNSLNIDIYNILGETVFSKSNDSNSEILIDLSFLKSGKYFVKIRGFEKIKYALLIIK